MLKGVNKQILEVTNTDNPYFEKIIFFVRSSAPNLDEGKLKTEAEKISATTQKPPKAKINKRKIFSSFGYCLLSVLAGVAITFIINRLV